MTGEKRCCFACGKESLSPKLPSGWKVISERTYCKDCRSKAFAVRAATLPAMEVVAGGTREEFLTAMRDAFRLSTELYNWGIRQLLAADVYRHPGMERMPPPPKLDLYNAYNAAGRPLGAASTGAASAVFRAAKKDYSRYRMAALWRGEQSLPLKRFPAPFPVRAQDIRGRLSLDNAGRPLVTFRLHATGSGPAWTLRLASSRDFARQTAMFAQLLSGAAGVGQMDLCAQSCGARVSGMAVSFRASSGGQRRPCLLMVKLVGTFPRVSRVAGCETMLLRTDPEAFLVAEIQGRCERPWLLNGDHVANSQRMIDWAADHATWLQRIGEDRKHEKRWPARQRRQFTDAYAKRCEKHRRRVNTWMGQMAGQVAGFAARRNVGEVLYDDGERGFIASFPWFVFRETLARRLETDGIRLTHSASGEVVVEAPGTAREAEVMS